MSDSLSIDSPAALERPDGAVRERRRNAALRELVEEMLVSIRVAANRELWTAAERAQYEQELAGIMARVRSEAVADGGSAAAPRDEASAP